VLSLLLADLEAKTGKRVNVERVLRLALLHDLPESLTFDISKEYLRYLGARGRAIKIELDHAAWGHIISGLREPGMRHAYARLQREFEEERTIESKLVHDADGLDILLQVIEYRRRGHPESSLGELWAQTNMKLNRSQLASTQRIRKVLLQESRKL
jgi:putative hydrolase of HD superfamily